MRPLPKKEELIYQFICSFIYSVEPKSIRPAYDKSSSDIVSKYSGSYRKLPNAIRKDLYEFRVREQTLFGENPYDDWLKEREMEEIQDSVCKQTGIKNGCEARIL